MLFLKQVVAGFFIVNGMSPNYVRQNECMKCKVT